MIEDLITCIREQIEQLNIKCFSPDLPQQQENCCSISVGAGNSVRSLCKSLYNIINCSILVRGTANDKETRKLADKIFYKLDNLTNLKYNDSRIIQILCDTPNYAFRDEKQKIHYNINIEVKIESE